MNTFFGAVLGFVLADVKVPDMIGFAQLLMFTAAIVPMAGLTAPAAMVTAIAFPFGGNAFSPTNASEINWPHAGKLCALTPWLRTRSWR